MQSHALQGVLSDTSATCLACGRRDSIVLRRPTPNYRSAMQLRTIVRSPPNRHHVTCCRASRDDASDDADSSGDSGGPEDRKQADLRLLDPAQTVVWGGSLPSRRRALVGSLTGLTVALGGNLGGLTSNLLALDGGSFAGRTRLDIIFPVADFKRCADYENGYEFQYPRTWLADQSIYRRAFEQGERNRSLDPLSLGDQRRKKRTVAEPTSAFGPPGTVGEENISVIAAPITAGFRLEDLGSPSEAGQRFLSSTVAPEGSGRTAELLAASSRTDGAGVLFYTLEYTLTTNGTAAPQTPQFFRHNLSVYAARDEVLYTFNAQCPEALWSKDAPLLRVAAASFELMPLKEELPVRY